jgi:methylated-DNA-[protein]-cysteine S-methyltransferase
MPAKKYLNILKNDNNLTKFQKKVYKVVLSIPEGETRSYKWVAKKVKNSKSARAVGNVLNKNPYVGKIPCHRVIKNNGSLGGFSMGRRKKKLLLHSEGLDLS